MCLRRAVAPELALRQRLRNHPTRWVPPVAASVPRCFCNGRQGAPSLSTLRRREHGEASRGSADAGHRGHEHGDEPICRRIGRRRPAIGRGGGIEHPLQLLHRQEAGHGTAAGAVLPGAGAGVLRAARIVTRS